MWRVKMFSRGLWLSALMVAASSVALAQIEDDSLDEINPWGQRYLPAGETEFPSDLWQASDTQFLLSQLQNLKVSRLSPAGQSLVKRLILSPAEAPQGEGREQILSLRAQLMLSLGQADAARQLAPRLDQSVSGLDAEILATDLDLAAGREASACARLSGPVRPAPYWQKLRAVCAALAENYSEAELAIEVAAAQNVSDPWLIEAIFSASGDYPSRPNARFDTGMNIAISAKAELDTAAITLSGSRPDLAAAAALRPGIPDQLRGRFAEIASRYELITPQTHRALLMQKLESAENIPVSVTEQALIELTSPASTMQQRADRLNRTFMAQTQSDFASYASTARLFLPDLRRLRTNPGTARYALNFARASLAAGDNAQARRWLASLDIEGVAEADAFEIALLEAIDLISGGEKSLASQRAITGRLADAANTDEKKTRAAQLFGLWTALDLQMPWESRYILNTQSDQSRRISAGRLLAIQAAARQENVAETVLYVLSELQSGAENAYPDDMAFLVQALYQIGAQDIASALAAEATQYWRG